MVAEKKQDPNEIQTNKGLKRTFIFSVSPFFTRQKRRVKKNTAELCKMKMQATYPLLVVVCWLSNVWKNKTISSVSIRTILVLTVIVETLRPLIRRRKKAV